MISILNPEALLDILEFSHYHQGLSFAQQSVRSNEGIQLASTLHCQNVDAELLANVQLTNGFSHPCMLVKIIIKEMPQSTMRILLVRKKCVMIFPVITHFFVI